MLDQSVRPHEEAIETAVGMDLLDAIEDPCDDVVSTWSLTTGEDDPCVEWLSCSGLAAGLKDELGQPVGVGEELLDSFLVAYALGCFAEDSLYIAL